MRIREAMVRTLDELRDYWFDENVGIVAATLVENGEMYSATSRYLPEQKRWLHAEAAALLKFEEKTHRKVEPNSLMVVTLSPCVGELANRVGISCSERLVKAGIKRVSFGWQDTKQTPSLKYYEEIGLQVMPVPDHELQTTCRALFELFHDLYDDAGRFVHLRDKQANPWGYIKLLIGLEPFLR